MTIQIVAKDAHPRGQSPRREWLSRIWKAEHPLALVIGINPNKATDTDEDGMTRFLSVLLPKLHGEFECGGYILVNCCDIRESDPKKLKEMPDPCSATNLQTIQARLDRCEFVVASWGTTDYGAVVATNRDRIGALLKQSGKTVICFSPKGRPIHCSRTNSNAGDGRWSDVPVQWRA